MSARAARTALRAPAGWGFVPGAPIAAAAGRRGGVPSPRLHARRARPEIAHWLRALGRVPGADEIVARFRVSPATAYRWVQVARRLHSTPPTRNTP